MIAERIEVHATLQPTPVREWDYAATFDSYDGAPDSSPRHNPVGYGRTRYDAIVALLREVED
jgi:hypothetical protein